MCRNGEEDRIFSPVKKAQKKGKKGVDNGGIIC